MAAAWQTARNNLSHLYWGILVAAVYLAFTVLIREPVAFWCLGFNLAMGSLLASAILFFVPLALLAMTGPVVVRVLTSSLLGVGGNVGRLTSISTLGSLLGTLLIGYLLIPLMPNSLTMYVTALALMAIALVYFLVFRRVTLIPVAFDRSRRPPPGDRLARPTAYESSIRERAFPRQLALRHVAGHRKTGRLPLLHE